MARIVFRLRAAIDPERLSLPVVDDVDLFAWSGKFQALANFDLLLLRVVLEAQYPFLFLLDIAMQLLVADFVLMHLPPLIKQTRNSTGTAKRDKRVDDSA
jgi:hypothetical protein